MAWFPNDERFIRYKMVRHLGLPAWIAAEIACESLSAYPTHLQFAHALNELRFRIVQHFVYGVSQEELKMLCSPRR